MTNTMNSNNNNSNNNTKKFNQMQTPIRKVTKPSFPQLTALSMNQGDNKGPKTIRKNQTMNFTSTKMME